MVDRLKARRSVEKADIGALAHRYHVAVGKTEVSAGRLIAHICGFGDGNAVGSHYFHHFGYGRDASRKRAEVGEQRYFSVVIYFATVKREALP